MAAAATHPGPNVLLLVMDTARLDAFQSYGGPAGATPALADLALRGVAHPGAVSPTNWTLPAHASMLTGLLPRTLGLAQAPGAPAGGADTLEWVHERSRTAAAVLDRHRERLLAVELARRGYSTRAISTNMWMSQAAGFGHGFEDFQSIDWPGPAWAVDGRAASTPAREGLQERRRNRLAWAAQAILARTDHGAREAERTIHGWLEKGVRRPFFWFVNLTECHAPYLPPRPYSDVSPRQRVRALEESRRYLHLDGGTAASLAGRPVPGESLRRMRHLYNRSITLMDDWLSRVLEMLDARRLLDDTLVIATSDHGENFGESNLIGHVYSLDDRLTRVPLIIAGPGATVARSWPVVSLADLPRLTALSLALPDHPWREQHSGTGATVAQFDPLVSADDPRAHDTAAEWGLDGDGFRRLTSRLTTATDLDHKLLRFGDEDLVYDLATDPLELHPTPVRELDGAGGSWGGLRALLDTAAAESVTTGAGGPEIPEDERRQIERQMRLLGYL